jgi:hypothetical protein
MFSLGTGKEFLFIFDQSYLVSSNVFLLKSNDKFGANMQTIKIFEYFKNRHSCP